MSAHAPPGEVSPLLLARRHLAAGAFLFLVTFLCGYLRMVPGVVGTLHDDGLYVATGQALAAGRGYVLPHLPPEVPQTKYPPLLPLLFALIWRFSPEFPSNAALFQVLCLALLAAALGLAYLLLVRFRYAAEETAFAACLLAATNPLLLFYGSIPMATGLFTFLFVLVLWTTEEALTAKGGGRRKGLAAGCAVALAGLCRTVGFAWAPVVAVFFLLRRKRALLPFLATAVPAAACWAAWSAAKRPEAADPLISYYVGYGQDWAETSPSDLPRLVLSNLSMLYQAVSFLLLPGVRVFLGLVAGKGVWSLLLTGLPVLTGAVRRGKEGRALPWLLAAYFLVIIFHPWPPNRFLLPAAPFALVFLLTEVASYGRRVLPSARRAGTAALLAALTLNIAVLARFQQKNSETGYPMPYYRDSPRWSSVEEGLRWLRRHTEEEAVIGCWLDPVVWLYAGRKSYRFNVFRPYAWFYDDERQLVEGAAALRARWDAHGTDYLLTIRKASFRVDGLTEEEIVSLTRGEKPALERVFASADGDVRIYRVVPEVRAESQ